MPVTYPATLPSMAWNKDVRGYSSVSAFDYRGPSAGDGGYVTGGEEVLPGAVKMGVIESADPAMAVKDTTYDSMVVYLYNLLTNKVQAFWGNTTPAGVWPEVTSGTDLSAYRGRFIVYGRG